MRMHASFGSNGTHLHPQVFDITLFSEESEALGILQDENGGAWGDEGLGHDFLPLGGKGWKKIMASACRVASLK